MELTGYQILGEVASGSTGTVYRARQVALGRDVAIKALDPALVGDPAFRERFRAEARVLAGLRDEHIVSLFEYLEDDTGAWIVQQWVEGASLGAVLGSHGPLTAEQSLGVTRGALLGLAAAHGSGVVHGDVSTSNILVTVEGVSTLVDFGLAGPSGSPGVLGTPAFISPEADGRSPVTPRSDVYSAAAVLVSLLTGAPPAGGDVGAVRTQHGDRLADVLGRCLATDPAARPADAAEMLALLDAAAEDRFGAGWLARSSVAGLVGGSAASLTRSIPDPVTDAPVTAVAAAMTATAGAQSPPAAVASAEESAGAAERGPKPKGKGRTVLVAGAAVAVVAVIAGVALSRSGNQDNAAAPGPGPTTTTQPSPTPSEPAFAGTYTVTTVITEVTGDVWGDEVTEGAKDVVTWTVSPECETGPCDVTATSSSGREWAFAYEDGAWVASQEAPLPCNDETTGEEVGRRPATASIRLEADGTDQEYPLRELEGTLEYVLGEEQAPPCASGPGGYLASATVER